MNNNEIFNEALGNVDLKYIASTAHAPKRKPVLLMRIVPIAAAVAILVSGVIAVFSMANRNKPEVPGGDEPMIVPPVEDTDTTTEQNQDTEPVQTEPEHTNTIVEGAYEIYSPNSSKLYPEGVGYVKGCGLSYYLKNEIVRITISYGFSKDFIDDIVSGEKQTNYYPLLMICKDEESFSTQQDLVINGYNGTITEKFSINEISKLNISKSKIDDGNHEILEMDFSKLPNGTTGRIIVKFGLFYDEKQEFFVTHPMNIYYIVTERGVAISLFSHVEALYYLDKVEVSGDVPETVLPSMRCYATFPNLELFNKKYFYL